MAEQMPLPPSFQQFRKQTAPVPAAAAAPSPYPGIRGILPAAVGTAIRLMPEEREALQQLGWQEGDPIPGNLADAIADAKASVQHLEHLLPVDPSTPPLEFSPLPLSHLPAAKQQELAAAVQQMIAQEKLLQTAPVIEGPGAESIRQALLEATKAQITHNQPAAPGYQPLPGAPPPLSAEQAAAAWRKLTEAESSTQPATVRPTEPPAAARVWSPHVNPVPEKKTYPAPEDIGAKLAKLAAAEHRLAVLEAELEATKAELAKSEKPGTSGTENLGHCPHCSWDLAAPDETVATESDKLGYLAMILGAPRFKRQVPLFGGSVLLTFRTLTVTESDMALAQTSADERKGQITGFNDILRRINDYRLALTLESIWMKSHARLLQLPDVTTLPPDEGEQTPLPGLLRYLHEVVLPSETLRRAAGFEFMRFNRMVEKIEANAVNQDFWQGIAVPA